MTTPQPRFPNPQACHDWLRANGINITQWCREQGFSRQVVADLLRGNRKGNRGEAHRAAVALGLKPDPADFTA